MKGTVYGVGVGPGDPELMTLKAVRLIRSCGAVAFPGRTPEESAAWGIAAAAVPELVNKPLIPVPSPMVRDREAIALAHRGAARAIETWLDGGADVAFLTLGDPSLYSTFSDLRRALAADGYAAEAVPGVTSFCAAAARLNVPLAEWDEPLRVLPAAHCGGEALTGAGGWVLMKSGSRLAELKEALRQGGMDAMMVERCGMAGERVYETLEAIPDAAGYFSLIIAKKG